MTVKKFTLCTITAFIIACSLFFCISPAATAEGLALPEPPTLEGIGAVYFYNITSDMLIHAENETKSVNTSTSAKVMMGLLACEKLGDRLNDHIQITKEMLDGVSGVQYGFKTGQSVLISDLLYAAICGSYNDAAYIVAHAVSGSTDGFVTLMNKRAHELGATQTTYTNPIGYPDNSSMVTTASDTAKIATAAYYNNLYMEICSAYKLTTSEGDIIYNRNYLVRSYTTSEYYNERCSGMNAGYSGEAGGWSVITVASDGEQKYLCVILGGNDDDTGKNYAYTGANTLIDWAFNEYQVIPLFSKGKEMGLIEIGLTGMTANHASYVTATDLNVYLQKDIKYHSDLLTPKIELISDKVNAPVAAGQKVGELKIYYDGKCVGKCDLVLTQDYKQNPILSGINKVSEYTRSRAFLISALTAVILIPVTILFVYRKTGHRRRSKRRYIKP